tara:strand:+ start:15283 stop:16059 length:777 start_codon:yes stop_codon:yes gene_type:complete
VNYFLSKEEQKKYNNEGFVLREDQLSSPELSLYREEFEKTVQKAYSFSDDGKVYFLDGKKFVDIDYLTLQFEPKPNEEYIKVIEPAHHLNLELNQIISDKRLTDPIKSILGVNQLSLWTDKLNLKRPRVGSGFGWHQDSPYWIHDSKDVDSLPNVYVCLDESNKNNGCFRVIRGSHKEGCLPGTFDESQLGGFYTDEGSFDMKDSLELEAKAGSLIFFNPHIVHGSSPNRSRQERRAYIITYQPKDRASLKSGTIKNI